MNDKRSIAATYTDWRTVKTRKVLQLTFEVPLEQTREVMEMLGTPMPDSDIWVAVALMGKEPGRLKGGEWARQAGIICADAEFRRYLTVTGDFPGVQLIDLDMAADELRRRLNIESRAHLDHDEEAARAFRELRTVFEQWKGGLRAEHGVEFHEPELEADDV